MAHVNAQRPLAHVPGYIRLPGPIIRRLLRLGLPIGPNMLLTVRGRVSGKSYSYPLAVMELDGRRWVIGTFGDTNWCRNMRANPEVELRHRGRVENVRARELTPSEATDFFVNTLPIAVARMPLSGRLASRAFIGFAAPEIKTDPTLAGLQRPVFELQQLEAK